jgi:hypothetical protein
VSETKVEEEEITKKEMTSGRHRQIRFAKGCKIKLLENVRD